jgi:CheY-like chemotaxis protein
VADSDPRRPRALVADDVETMREFVAVVLERNGFDVTSASEGVEAVAKFETARFDLVVLDVNMPRLDGLAALRTI